MAQMESNRAMLLRECEEAVDRLLSQRSWQLLGRDEWARRVLELLLAGRAATPQRAAVYVYSLALHAACSGAEGRQRQNLGYDELFRYLYDGARRRYPELAEDVTQQAIERVFMLFARCHTTSAFLAFAFQQLLEAGRSTWRQEAHSGWLRAAGQADLTGLADRRQADLAAPLIADELHVRFERLTVEFLHKHPRARQQLMALRLKYIDGLDEAAISRRLGRSVGSVYTLRARAIAKLRAEPAWRALAVEFGILPEDSS
jgi:DNA-directed RNA polymerase specialized sigma24 family protein